MRLRRVEFSHLFDYESEKAKRWLTRIEAPEKNHHCRADQKSDNWPFFLFFSFLLETQSSMGRWWELEAEGYKWYFRTIMDNYVLQKEPQQDLEIDFSRTGVRGSQIFNFLKKRYNELSKLIVFASLNVNICSDGEWKFYPLNLGNWRGLESRIKYRN